MFKSAVKEVGGLENFFPETDAIFSPDESYVVTGTSAKKGQATGGKLVFLDRYTLETKHEEGTWSSRSSSFLSLTAHLLRSAYRLPLIAPHRIAPHPNRGLFVECDPCRLASKVEPSLCGLLGRDRPWLL